MLLFRIYLSVLLFEGLPFIGFHIVLFIIVGIFTHITVPYYNVVVSFVLNFVLSILQK
eukprot:m.10079 g.10079  ORF g.10079 m.10079 type:complete len:58 (-) comp6505_c0_seq3:1302-1475(-)